MSSEEQQVCRVALLASLDPTGQFKRVSAATSLLVDDDKCSLHPVLLEADEAGPSVSSATSRFVAYDDDESLALCNVALQVTWRLGMLLPWILAGVAAAAVQEEEPGGRLRHAAGPLAMMNGVPAS